MAPSSAAAGNAGVIPKPSLTFQRRLNAPPEKVWAAWTDPEKLARWFGPARIKQGSVQAEIDARAGGRYRIRFDGEDGEYFEVAGVYREVVPNARLSFTWAWYTTPERESLVTVSLKPDGDATLLTLHHEQFFDEKARDGHAHGWTELLGKLETYFA